MRKKGVWQTVTLNNYSFVNDEDKVLTMTFDNLGTSSVKIDNKIVSFPSINSSLDRELLVSSAIPYSIALYDYWLGTGKVNINSHIYEFKRESITSVICLNKAKDIIISFEELDPFSIEYSANYYTHIDQEKSLLLCIGLFFYLKSKKSIF